MSLLVNASSLVTLAIINSSSTIHSSTSRSTSLVVQITSLDHPNCLLPNHNLFSSSVARPPVIHHSLIVKSRHPTTIHHPHSSLALPSVIVNSHSITTNHHSPLIHSIPFFNRRETTPHQESWPVGGRRRTRTITDCMSLSTKYFVDHQLRELQVCLRASE